MNHPIAQFVALTCYANAFLRSRSVPQFFPTNSTVKFCDYVKFLRVSKPLVGRGREEEVADSPDAWFTYLQGADVSALHLVRAPQSRPKFPDRMTAGLVDGGGTWAMEAVQPSGTCAVWLSRWEVWNQNAPERRIWRVSYRRVSERRSSTAHVTELRSAAGRLRSTLADIRAFSEKQKWAGFTTCFARAIETLDSGGKTRYGYHRDLAPAGCLPSLAESVLDACQSAWVFGGMGSWNDVMVGSVDRSEYDRTSEQLFLALTEAMHTAANASCVADG